MKIEITCDNMESVYREFIFTSADSDRRVGRVIVALLRYLTTENCLKHLSGYVIL